MASVLTTVHYVEIVDFKAFNQTHPILWYCPYTTYNQLASLLLCFWPYFNCSYKTNQLFIEREGNPSLKLAGDTGEPNDFVSQKFNQIELCAK